MNKLIDLTLNDKRKSRTKCAKNEPKLHKTQETKIKKKQDRKPNIKVKDANKETRTFLSEQSSVSEVMFSKDENLVLPVDTNTEGHISYNDVAEQPIANSDEDNGDKKILESINNVKKCIEQIKSHNFESNVSTVKKTQSLHRISRQKHVEKNKKKHESINFERKKHGEELGNKTIKDDDLNNFQKDLDIDQSYCNILQTCANNLNMIDHFKRNSCLVFPDSDDSIENEFESALEIETDDIVHILDDEFGRNIFDNKKDNFIVEAYNKPGQELVETFINVEHKIVYGISPALEESKNSEENDSQENYAKTHIKSDVYINLKENNFYNEEDNNFLDVHKDGGFVEVYNTTDKNFFLNNMTSHGSQTVPQYQDICKRYEIDSQIMNDDNAAISKTGKCEENLNMFHCISLPKTEDENNNSHAQQSCLYFKHNSEMNNDTCRNIFPITKVDLIIQELVDTEKVYIENLEKVVSKYIPYFRKFGKPFELKVAALFGNIEEIYNETKIFYKKLLQCDNNYDKIGVTFLRFKGLFELYPLYSRNKPISDMYVSRNFKDVIKARQKTLNDKLDLSSYLLNPIQRLGRYILMLENLHKTTKYKSTNLNEAVELLKGMMKRGNDFVAIASIINCPKDVDLTLKGSFVQRESFTMIKPRRCEITIFLFEGIVVLTTPDLNCSEKFVYKNSINMSDLSIVTIEGEDQIFRLKNFPMCKKGEIEQNTFVIEARDAKLKRYWTKLIEEKLWKQFEQYKDERKKLPTFNFRNDQYEKKLVKTNSDVSTRKRNSIFYIDSRSLENLKEIPR